MSILDSLLGYFGKKNPAPDALMSGEDATRDTEKGARTTPEQQWELEMARLMPSFLLRNKILDIRNMDELDPRVKKVHERTARTACNGGLRLTVAPTATRVLNLWDEFERRLELNRREKLESDMRGALMEGNLPMQWVLDLDSQRVVRGIRMPTETLKPLVSAYGQFLDPARAYEQWDLRFSGVIATFPLWQLNLVRIRPDNYDNWGCFGRPYLDSTRMAWRQLQLTEKDLVVRRHTRAPQRFSHVLEGASGDELRTYREQVEGDQNRVTTDFFSNRRGSVTGLAGDGNLDQIADVVHLLDTFMSGAPAPKALFGYVGDLSRDVLEDLKRDYFDELDALQDSVSFIYEMGFRLDLLLHGINPDAEKMSVQFMERRTDTPNQRADLALKYQSMMVPPQIVHRTAGLDPAEVQKYAETNRSNSDPYPDPNKIRTGVDGSGAAGAPRVSITPGNARKGESGTSVSH